MCEYPRKFAVQGAILLLDFLSCFRYNDLAIRRCIEVVVTRLTRNQLTGNTVRGFESLHLRQKSRMRMRSGFLLIIPKLVKISGQMKE